MPQELEAKFIDVDKEKLQRQLLELGAEKIFSERLLRRCVYNLPVEKKGAWARVRDEGDKVTMTYKRFTEARIDGVEEVELTVNDFDTARAFLKSLGLTEKAYQETKRMRYKIAEDDVEFDIDTWPGLSPWLEIEGTSAEIVKKYAKLLGFSWDNAMFGSADLVYEKVYKVDKNWINNHCPILKFDELPDKLQPANLR